MGFPIVSCQVVRKFTSTLDSIVTSMTGLLSDCMVSFHLVNISLASPYIISRRMPQQQNTGPRLNRTTFSGEMPYCYANHFHLISSHGMLARC